MVAQISKRTILHYGLAFLLLSVYGIQVCPFIESLTPLQLLLPSLLVFMLMGACRFYRGAHFEQQNYKLQVKQQFKLDLFLYVFGGLALSAFNTVYFGFPLESGLKIIVGMTFLGYMVACDLALFREYRIAQHLAKTGESLQPDENPYPLTQKFTWFAIFCAVAMVGVIFLVISKDLDWLVHTGDSIPLPTAQRYILAEVVFVVGVMMAYVLAIILGYSRNLKLFIAAENQTLRQVSEGQFGARVPVTSNDEFGVMALQTNHMIRALAERTKELSVTRDASILGLASLAETRDNETGGHILRTQNYVRALAVYLSQQPKYEQQLDAETIDLLYKSSPLHDVGKVGIPDSILLKPGKLTDEEFDIMKRHPQIGADALAVAERQLGSNSFLAIASEISLTHHEKWDGSGYPKQLKGEQIPLSGRLMALADVYDALITKRVYKPAFSHEKAKGIIVEGRGNHFDPDIVDAFLALEQDFIRIADEFCDEAMAAAAV